MFFEKDGPPRGDFFLKMEFKMKNYAF